ncbi:ABC transporter substrate-binding protein [Marinobacter orientalis]|uniref:Transporter substrate-binding domain-containing protein n=1 Tax=Marinobacter orientalis TaxID=1928859 RepID=A0A7Y0RE40_9GAMM|nr:transporter substrate-binding domain-containing protein [Marinobacter orientalis]NMT64543.1 transporter substrate-binding domain-containing protein [Marinobacter orientalis]TGX50505.1 transporter substrate-binding domain-containing protein [Marinobacter orientalis]
MKIKTIATVLTAVLGASFASQALADKLDDIINSETLRCAVTLDFPPMGFRDDNNEPAGFDVDYCNDLAEALGVEAEIVGTPFPDRIPAILSGRADVIVASTSDTLGRAQVVGMSIPYFAFQMVVLTREDADIDSYEDLEGRPVGNTSGTFEAMALEKDVKKWADEDGTFRSYQSQNDTILAVAQGHIDATVVTNTVASSTLKAGKYEGLKIAGDAPYVTDFVSLAAKRDEYGLLNYLNLFIHQQVRTGRYAELYDKWVGGEPVNLTVPGVYY